MKKSDIFKNSKGAIKHKKCSEGQIKSEKHDWREALTWAKKELKKHEKTCDFVKDPTRRACKNNCGFYGLLDATARHEVNCDYIDPRIAKTLEGSKSAHQDLMEFSFASLE